MILPGLARKKFPARAIRNLAVLLPLAWTLTAGEARIDRIELLPPDYVAIHFDTEANRTYELQYVNHLPTNGSAWSNLYVAPNLPWPNHYVVTDYRTNQARFYRLRITP